MFCINCGEQLPDEAKFCLQCGKPQRPDGTAPVAVRAVAPAESQWETCSIDWQQYKHGKRSNFVVRIRDSVPARKKWSDVWIGYGAIVQGLPSEYQRLNRNQQATMAAALDSLVKELQEEGWETIPATSVNWWNRDFRRRADSPNPYEKAAIHFREVKSRGFMSAAKGQFYGLTYYGPHRSQEIGESQLVVSNQETISRPGQYDVTVPIPPRATEGVLRTLSTQIIQAGWIPTAPGEDWYDLRFRRPIS